MQALYKKAKDDGIVMNGCQILEKVLKPKSGYVRGLGHGVKPTKSRESELEALLHAEKVDSEKRVGELTDQIQNQNVQIESQQTTINDLQKEYNHLKSLVDKLWKKQMNEGDYLEGKTFYSLI